VCVCAISHGSTDASSLPIRDNDINPVLQCELQCALQCVDACVAACVAACVDACVAACVADCIAVCVAACVALFDNDINPPFLSPRTCSPAV